MNTPVTMDELKDILAKHAAWLADEEFQYPLFWIVC